MAEDPFQKQQWLRVNWQTLVKAKVPAMKIVDMLVFQGVYDPSDDDYQLIETEPTAHRKVHILLGTLRSKSGGAVDIFKEALGEVCPRVLATCFNPPDALEELDIAARSYYEENLKVRPLSWLSSSWPVNASTLFLNLSMVQKSVAENMMSNLASSSAKELERPEYLYSRPNEQTLVRLDSLFPQFQIGRTAETGAIASKSGVVEPTPKGKYVAFPSSSSTATVVVGGEEDTQSCMLQSGQHVGIYGGAGCGKTSCLMKAASMYAEGSLWQGACTLLLWKLCDPKVQNADSLKQLLRQLKLNLTDGKCKELADALEASDGERVILALDGVDELDMRREGYIWNLLDGSALPKACVLATSRSCSTEKSYFDKYEANLEVLGFTEGQMYEFILQELGNKPELLSGLHRVLLENPTLASLMLVPLLAMMVCQVFRLTPGKPPTTRTALYSTLLCLVLRRTVAKGMGRVTLSAGQYSGVLAVSNLLKLDGTPKALVSELAQVAFLAHTQGNAVFDHNLIKEASCSNEALQLGLLCSHDIEEGLNVVPHYSFQHLTVQEFLVAYCLVAHTTSEQAVRDKVSELVSSRDNHFVLQFFAGLLAESLRPHFFARLNQWLHEGFGDSSRLRVCLQCAKEACGENVKDFPSTLQLPERVRLEHVTAADLTQLSLAVEKSQHIKRLDLSFDVVEVELEKKKVSRVKTQTRLAMTRLMAAINANKSLRNLIVWGPKYSLFEEEGWRLLVRTAENNSLESLTVVCCALDNTSFHFLSNALKHNTQLRELCLQQNSLNDVSVCTLADDLKHNNTLDELNLFRNSYEEDSREYLKRQLKHITLLRV